MCIAERKENIKRINNIFDEAKEYIPFETFFKMREDINRELLEMAECKCMLSEK